MKKYSLIFCISILFAFYGCMNDDIKLHSQLKVQLGFQNEFGTVNPDNIDVVLTNRVTGRKFSVKTNNSGLATFTVEGGIYNISSTYNMSADSVFNGSVEDVVVAEIENQGLVTMDMIFGKLSPLVFKEIYFSGSRTPANKSYYADQFHEVYNNSLDVQYLDGLCIGVLQPSSSSASKWVDENGNVSPLLPINFMAWRIPGEGTDYPLQPGESIVIAQDGINHMEDPSGNPNSPVDMSNADWETYFDLSGKDTDSPSVPNLQMMWANTTRMYDWLHSTSGSAVILFRIPGSWQEFVDNPDNLMTRPGSTSSTKYLMIPKDYVIDAVECVRSETKNYKRLPNDLDAGYIYCTGSYSKESIRRKVKEIKNGRVIYRDTNNSSEDFVVSTIPTPWVNPTNVD